MLNSDKKIVLFHRAHFVPAPQPHDQQPAGQMQAGLMQQPAIAAPAGMQPVPAQQPTQSMAHVYPPVQQQQVQQITGAVPPSFIVTPGGVMPQSSPSQVQVQVHQGSGPPVHGVLQQQQQQQLFPSGDSLSSSDATSTSSSGSSGSSGSTSSWGSANKAGFQSLRAEDVIPFDAYVFQILIRDKLNITIKYLKVKMSAHVK